MRLQFKDGPDDQIEAPDVGDYSYSALVAALVAVWNSGNAEVVQQVGATVSNINEILAGAVSGGSGGGTPPPVYDAIDEFGNFMRGLIRDLHSQAAYLGRVLAGDQSPLGQEDLLFGKAVAAGQEVFLQGFLTDIESGKYTLDDGTLNLAKIEWRAKLYISRVRGTANEAWARTLEPTVLVYWRDNGDEQECSSCPGVAQGGPYIAGALPGYPGDGSVCDGGVMCRCWLETVTGEKAFGPWPDEAEGE